MIQKLAIYFLFCLLSLSFLGDAGYISIPSQEKIELSDDQDAEQELEEDDAKKQHYVLSHAAPSMPYFSIAGPTYSLPLNSLFHRSYDVEMRPPRS